MKNLVLLILLFLSINNLLSQVYVKHDAVGNNDGTSWENAYTNLEIALLDSDENSELWVAAGTYKPGNTITSTYSTFRLTHALKLYGGFIGTETNLDERDFIQNKTILSGDRLGNDIDNNFTDNRTDNAIHVMVIPSEVNKDVEIDGFTIRNGNTFPDASPGNYGGGLYIKYGDVSTGDNPELGIIIRNCHFTQNYAYTGGGIFCKKENIVLVEDCIFSNNSTIGGGGGITVYPISLSQFSLAPIGSTVNINRCIFNDNLTDIGGGGAIHIFGENRVQIDSSYFNNNQSTSSGGAIQNRFSNLTVSNSTFTNNQAQSNKGGGAITYLNSFGNISNSPKEMNITNCTFIENQAPRGGALSLYNPTTVTNIFDCDFFENSSTDYGGAISNLNGAKITIRNSVFQKNSSAYGGAVINSGVQTTSPTLMNIDQSTFNENSADVGGAISNGYPNSSVLGISPTMNITNSYITSNIVTTIGGGIYSSKGNSTITNCLVSENKNNSPTNYGGGIAFFSIENYQSENRIINSTIVNNESNLGAGISHRGNNLDSSFLYIQNTILSNPDGGNFYASNDSSLIALFSEGGNLSSDDTMDDYLISTNDAVQVDPLFLDEFNSDYALSSNSPCINTGIDNNVPTIDILGNFRIGIVDKGAYEFQPIVSIGNTINETSDIKIFPNPIQDVLSFSLENNWSGNILIRIFDSKGALVKEIFEEKTTTSFQQSYQLEHLEKGIYFLTITDFKNNLSKKFAKM